MSSKYFFENPDVYNQADDSAEPEKYGYATEPEEEETEETEPVEEPADTDGDTDVLETDQQEEDDLLVNHLLNGGYTPQQRRVQQYRQHEESVTNYQKQTGSSGAISPREAYQYYTQHHGLAPHVAAGIVGNLQQESGRADGLMNPHAVGDNGTSYGLAQWHNNRWEGAKRAAGKAGKSVHDPYFQLDYVLHEPGESGRMLARANQTHSPEEAARSVGRTYERYNPVYANETGRAQNARQLSFQEGGSTGGGLDFLGGIASNIGGQVANYALESIFNPDAKNKAGVQNSLNLQQGQLTSSQQQLDQYRKYVMDQQQPGGIQYGQQGGLSTSTPRPVNPFTVGAVQQLPEVEVHGTRNPNPFDATGYYISQQYVDKLTHDPRYKDSPWSVGGPTDILDPLVNYPQYVADNLTNTQSNEFLKPSTFMDGSMLIAPELMAERVTGNHNYYGAASNMNRGLMGYGRDQVGHLVHPEMAYRATSEAEIKAAIKTGKLAGKDYSLAKKLKGHIAGLDEYREGVNNSGMDWYLGKATNRYGDYVMETPADRKYFTATAATTANDPKLIHLKSSPYKKPIPYKKGETNFYKFNNGKLDPYDPENYQQGGTSFHQLQQYKPQQFNTTLGDPVMTGQMLPEVNVTAKRNQGSMGSITPGAFMPDLSVHPSMPAPSQTAPAPGLSQLTVPDNWIDSILGSNGPNLATQAAAVLANQNQSRQIQAMQYQQLADQPYLKPKTNKGLTGPGTPAYGQQGMSKAKKSKYKISY